MFAKIPPWMWAIGGLVLVGALYYFHSKQAAQQAAAAAAAAKATQNNGLVTNVLSPGAAPALTQGAGPSAYLGGNIYNNILNQPSANAGATSSATAGSTAQAPTNITT